MGAAWDTVKVWSSIDPHDTTVPCPEIVLQAAVVVSLLLLVAPELPPYTP